MADTRHPDTRHDEGSFRAVGVGRSAERLYLRLLETPAASAASLAERADVPAEAVLRDLSELEEHGLVIRIPETESRYAAAPPGIALDGLVTRHQEALQGLRADIGQLEERYRSTRDPRSPELVEVVTGARGISQRFQHLQRDAHNEVLNLVKLPYAVSSAENSDEYEAIARGVTYRVVYDTEALAVPGELAEIARFVAAGERARAGGPLPVKLAIADRSIALVPLVSATVSMDSGALVVHPSGLLDALIALFEFCWSAATPLRLSPDAHAASDDRPTAQELNIVSLLLAGLTDRAVASQTGTSVRTVVRRVQSLMEYTGVRTRMQLAYEAARRGWI